MLLFPPLLRFNTSFPRKKASPPSTLFIFSQCVFMHTRACFCVRGKVNLYAGHHEPLLPVMKHWKLSWFGHVVHNDTLSKIILHGTVTGKQRKWRQKNDQDVVFSHLCMLLRTKSVGSVWVLNLPLGHLYNLCLRLRDKVTLIRTKVTI